MSKVPSIELDELLDVSLPSGEVYRIRPGPYGKGIAIVPLALAVPRTKSAPGTGKRGRKPRLGTAKLRSLLAKDAAKGKFLTTRAYVKFVMGQDPTISLNVARQTVYRELRKVQ